jgi:hypothetical protein
MATPWPMLSMGVLVSSTSTLLPMQKRNAHSPFTPVAINMVGQTTPDMVEIKNNSDLLAFIISQANSGQKNWFGFQQQRILGINAAYEIAVHHADKMTADEIVDFVINLNNAIYNKMIKG